MNGDGKTDLIFSNPPADAVSVLISNGDGTFQRTDYPVDGYPAYIAIADFNGDGILDLAVADESGTLSYALIFLGNGDGAFTPGTAVENNAIGFELFAADFNNDGKADLASSNTLGDDVLMLLGNGDATFTESALLGGPVPIGGYTAARLHGQESGKGGLDIILTNGSKLLVLINLAQKAVPHRKQRQPRESTVFLTINSVLSDMPLLPVD